MEKCLCQGFYVISVTYEILFLFMGKIMPPHYKIYEIKQSFGKFWPMSLNGVRLIKTNRFLLVVGVKWWYSNH